MKSMRMIIPSKFWLLRSGSSRLGSKRFFFLGSSALSSERNYYEVLGVQRTATSAEIKEAYLDKCKEFHPDKHADDPNKELFDEKFKELNQAYSVLIQPRERTTYDLMQPYINQDNPYPPSGLRYQQAATFQQRATYYGFKAMDPEIYGNIRKEQRMVVLAIFVFAFIGLVFQVNLAIIADDLHKEASDKIQLLDDKELQFQRITEYIEKVKLQERIQKAKLN